MISRIEAENRVLTGFWIHFGVYCAVITGLGILNYTRNPDNLWFVWVLGGWGIGSAAHAAAVFLGDREKLIGRVQERVSRRQDRREERRMHSA